MVAGGPPVVSFLWPWTLWGAVLLPALLAIYYLRRRARRRTVPSLLLWAQQPPRRAAGRRWQRLETSRLLILELLLLALLVLSALGPWLPTDHADRPLVVVLDDSLSMTAGGDDSAMVRGRRALDRELRQGRHGEVHWLLAGRQPQRLEVQGRRVPDAWRGGAPSADLGRSLQLARELGGPEARVLVITDGLPDDDIAAPWLRWWAFGTPRGNAAWVGASRRPGSDEDHVLLEVRNFSTQRVSRSVELVALSAEGEPLVDIDLNPLQPDPLELGPEERRLLRWRVPRGLGLQVQLAPSDAQELDDQVVLLPSAAAPVAVRLNLEPGPTRDLLRRTLLASGLARLIPAQVDAVVDLEVWGPGRTPQTTGAPWVVVLGAGGGEPKPYVGPFVLDTQHPLAEGLALEGVVWSAGGASLNDLPLSARPVVSAGDVPLLIDRGPVGGSHRVDLRWQPRLSNLQRTPNWPILWWNLLDTCRQQRPGVTPRNGRLDGMMHFRPHPDAKAAQLELPDGERRTLRLDGRPADGFELPIEQAGWHRLEAGESSHAFVVNALAPDESDLSRAASGRLGSWDEAQGAAGRLHLLPYGVLLALILSILHLAWSAAGPGRVTSSGAPP